MSMIHASSQADDFWLAQGLPFGDEGASSESRCASQWTVSGRAIVMLAVSPVSQQHRHALALQVLEANIAVATIDTQCRVISSQHIIICWFATSSPHERLFGARPCTCPAFLACTPEYIVSSTALHSYISRCYMTCGGVTNLPQCSLQAGMTI